MEKKGKRGRPKKTVFWFIEPCNMQTQRDFLDRGYIWSYDVNVPTSEGIVGKLYSSSGEIVSAKLKHNSILQSTKNIQYKVYKQIGSAGEKVYQPDLSKVNHNPPVR